MVQCQCFEPQNSLEAVENVLHEIVLTISYMIHKTITASIIDGFNILLEYTKRFRPFHLVLFRVNSEKKITS